MLKSKTINKKIELESDSESEVSDCSEVTPPRPASKLHLTKKAATLIQPKSKLNLSNNKTTKAVDTMSTESKSDTEDIVSKKESYKEPPIVPNMDRLILTQSTNKFAGCSSQFIESVELFNIINASKIIELKKELETKAQEYDDVIYGLKQELKNKQHENEVKLNTKTQEYDDVIYVMRQELKNKQHENEIKYNTKKYEYDETIKQFDRSRLAKQIETNERLKEFHIKACQTLAKKNNYIVIPNKDYKKLKSNVADLTDKYTKLFNKKHAIFKEKTAYEKKIIQDTHKYEMDKVKLMHRSETADLNAFIKHQKREVEILKSTSTTMKQEIIEQRLLTKEIAVASSSSNIQQKFA